jgi:hypothetical protein
MAQPGTRTDFKEFCLRALGKDVLEINVSDNQVEDRIDDAIQYWQEFHVDALVEDYFKTQLTQTDIDNEYITVGNNVAYITRVIPINQRSGFDSSLFNIEYQLHLNDLFDLSFSGGVTTYVQARQYLGLLDDLFQGIDHFQYSRYENKLNIQLDWDDDVKPGDYIVTRGYRFIDPAATANAWNDRWLKAYAQALIQKQWGLNLIKFNGVELIGGITMDGTTIYNEGKARQAELEDEMQRRYQPPVDFFIG